MKTFVSWIQGLAVTWGGPGLLVIGFLDSSFLSFPEVNDLLIIFMVTRHKHLVLYYALMATIGSVLGCLALYYVARKGGEAFLRKRFRESHVEAGLKLYPEVRPPRRHCPGALAAARAVQDLRPPRRRGRRADLAVRRRGLHGAVHPVLRGRAARGLLW